MKILGVAIVMIALLASCGGKGKTSKSSKESGMNIAYYLQDSIPGNFEYYKTNTQELMAEEEGINARLGELQAEGTKLAQLYESKMAQGLLAPNGQKFYQNKIGEIQKEMQSIQESEGAVLNEKNNDFTKELLEKMEQYAREFSEENGYDVLFARQKGGQILYMDSTKNVTMDFIEYMNEQEKK